MTASLRYRAACCSATRPRRPPCRARKCAATALGAFALPSVNRGLAGGRDIRTRATVGTALSRTLTGSHSIAESAATLAAASLLRSSASSAASVWGGASRILPSVVAALVRQPGSGCSRSRASTGRASARCRRKVRTTRSNISPDPNSRSNVDARVAIPVCAHVPSLGSSPGPPMLRQGLRGNCAFAEIVVADGPFGFSASGGGSSSATSNTATGVNRRQGRIPYCRSLV
jgi:hypothetical protein